MNYMAYLYETFTKNIFDVQFVEYSCNISIQFQLLDTNLKYNVNFKINHFKIRSYKSESYANIHNAWLTTINCGIMRYCAFLDNRIFSLAAIIEGCRLNT